MYIHMSSDRMSKPESIVNIKKSHQMFVYKFAMITKIFAFVNMITNRSFRFFPVREHACVLVITIRQLFANSNFFYYGVN